jgi:tetraacyldisaccharide 4'-kinase
MKTRLQKQIENIINDHAAPDPPWLGTGLLAASLLYGWGVQFRTLAYTKGLIKSRRLPCAVVSIGNITVGGTGKTPMAIYLARLIRNSGLKTVVISRGYGGKAEKRGGIVCDGRRVLMQPAVSGDEPYMIAKQLETVPVLVGSDRYRSGMTAVRKFKPDVILLDDGFQHTKLERDMDIVLMDAEKPLGNGYLLPRGSLRENETALKRCDTIVFTRAKKTETIADKNLIRLMEGKFIFHSSHEPYLLKIIREKNDNGHCHQTNERGLRGIAGKRAFAFSGIARNNDFKTMLENLGCSITGFASFSDHYRYTQEDIKRIVTAAVQNKSDCMVTTEKDYFRIHGALDFPLDLVVIGVKIQFKDDTFDHFIKRRLLNVI